MSSVSKHKKLSDESRTPQDEDRLSKLPNCLVTKILSSLPTKDAVATSILSTKWRRSWTSITHVDFDDELKKSHKSSFTSFVNRVLLLVQKDTILQRFRLKCMRYTNSQINWWITAALMCYVKEIDLSISIPSSSALPGELFLCRRLKVLKLGTQLNVYIPDLVNLCSLVVLHLCGVVSVDGDSFSRLISGCPLLEELSIKNCTGERGLTINISSPMLKKLTLAHLDFGLRSSQNSNYKVLICTPSLITLEITDCAKVHYVLKDANHLKTAKLDLGSYISLSSSDQEAIHSLLNGVSKVRFLSFSLYCSRILRDCKLDSLFENLTVLDLDVVCQFPEVQMFLNNSPIIETLVFQKAALYLYGTFRAIPLCLGSHLKVIEFMKFGGTKEELRLVQYFLAKANVLEKMIIHYHQVMPFFETNSENKLSKIKKELECSNTLLKLPRVSSACQVVIL